MARCEWCDSEGKCRVKGENAQETCDWKSIPRTAEGVYQRFNLEAINIKQAFDKIIKLDKDVSIDRHERDVEIFKEFLLARDKLMGMATLTSILHTEFNIRDAKPTVDPKTNYIHAIMAAKKAEARIKSKRENERNNVGHNNGIR
jgi:hypothetical protein